MLRETYTPNVYYDVHNDVNATTDGDYYDAKGDHLPLPVEMPRYGKDRLFTDGEMGGRGDGQVRHVNGYTSYAL